jgi:small acid-soluble spore protein (thioredoxin-like protein)
MSKFEEVNMANSRHRKPDDRSNNVERMRDIVKNTEEKVQEAEISMEFADPLENNRLKEKNKRRKQSIEALKEEMKDEMAARKKGEV